jgi:hypothetical protein
MTGDEAAVLAHDIAHNWPAPIWTPALLTWWTQQLQTLDHQQARDALLVARRRHIDPPSWSNFMGCYRPEEPPRHEPGLDLPGHRAAIADLRQQHKFITRD